MTFDLLGVLELDLEGVAAAAAGEAMAGAMASGSGDGVEVVLMKSCEGKVGWSDGWEGGRRAGSVVAGEGA